MDEQPNEIVQDPEYLAPLEEAEQNKKNFRLNCWIIGGLMAGAIAFTFVLKIYNLQ